MIYVRSLIFNILAYSIILFGCIITCIVGFFVPKKWIWIWWNDCLLPLSRRLLKVICGLEIEIRGKEHIENRVAIYASKHQSAMETYYLTSYIKKATYIFKKELTHIPFFGWAIWFYGSVPVNRKGGTHAMKEMLLQISMALKNPIDSDRLKISITDLAILFLLVFLHRSSNSLVICKNQA